MVTAILLILITAQLCSLCTGVDITCNYISVTNSKTTYNHDHDHEHEHDQDQSEPCCCSQLCACNCCNYYVLMSVYSFEANILEEESQSNEEYYLEFYQYGITCDIWRPPQIS